MSKLFILIAILAGTALSLSAQSTITLRGTTYTLNGHPRVFFDGPGGAISTGIKDPDGPGGGRAPKALDSNPPWAAVKARAAFWLNNYPYSDPNNVLAYGGQQASIFAMYWYSDNSQTAYHDAALDMVTHIERYFPMFCDEAVPSCITGNAGYYVGGYGMVYWLPDWIFAYELMRGEMTTAQRQAFADKILNDIPAFGGVGGAAATSCTNPSAIPHVPVTVSGKTFTASAPLFGPGHAIQAGDWVASDDANAGLFAWALVVSVVDSTHATFSSVSSSNWNGYAGSIGARRSTWQPGDCGILWVAKHDRFIPKEMTDVNGSSVYLPWGGSQAVWSSNNTFSAMTGMFAALLSVTDDDLNSTSRSQYEAGLLYNGWYQNFFQPLVETGWTGFNYTGSVYGALQGSIPLRIPSMLKWSLSGGGPPVSGLWNKNVLYRYIMNWFPSCAVAEPQWGQDVGNSAAFGSPGNFADANGTTSISMAYAGLYQTTEGMWFNWTLRNRLGSCSSYGNTPGTNLFWTPAALNGASIYATSEWMYAYTDPTWGSLDISAAGPTAVALNRVDAPSNQTPQSVLLSRTGYSRVTDTLLNFYGLYENVNAGDHNYPNVSPGFYPGTYKIFKGNYLLGADGFVNGQYSQVSNNYHGGSKYSDYMELGGGNDLVSSSFSCGAIMPRANTDGTANRFAYAVVDSTKCYVATTRPVRVLRQLADFKGGSQQFVVVYDDVATSTGQMKRTYLHYPNNFGASTDSTRGTTVIAGDTITSTNPGTGHSDATQLLTKILAPGQNQIRIYTDHPDGTYDGGQGSTFRVSLCASSNGTACDTTNTAAEFLVVHEPATGTSNTLPPISVITTDTNWRGIQIDGPSPKVAVFARNGGSNTSLTFTSTHSGIAQILIAGLQPGTYRISGVSSPAMGTVGADGVLYGEGAGGTYTIAPEAPRRNVIRGAAALGGQTGVR